MIARAALLAAVGSLAACGVDYEELPGFHVASGRTIVCLGDSLTAGARLGKSRSWPAHLDETLTYEVVNSGENGDTTAQALARFDRDVTSHAPTIVVILIGGNDGLRRGSADAAARNVRRLIERVVEIDAVPVLIGFDMGLIGAGFTSFLEGVAQETGARFLDDVIDDVLRTPSLKIDRVHPNEAGHARIAERLREPITALIDALDAR